MRTISVSTDTFARIWALRAPGEDSEDQILSRVLETKTSRRSTSTLTGLFDARSGVTFPAGFEIFRTYKGVDYSATAEARGWRLRNTGELFRTLNLLSQSIVSGNENAWMNWRYVSEDGKSRLVAELRSSVDRRDRISNKTATGARRGDVTWRSDVVRALENLGGRAHLDRIYTEVRKIRGDRGATLPMSTDAVIRRELENNSSDSGAYQGRYDLFESPFGIGTGVWALRGQP